MPKPSAVSALAIAALLLSGCSSSPGGETEPIASELKPSASASASPVETSSPTVEPTPSEEPTPEETPAPVETEEPEPVAAPEPLAEPAPEPAVETPETTEAPVAPIESLPVGPNDPFVPPPHGEPNPYANPYPDVPAGSPHTGPVTEENRTVAHPQPGSPGPTIGILPGVLRIGGHGYAPGEMIDILLAVPNSDYNLLNPQVGYRSEPVVVYADPNGSYTFDIDIAPSLAPGNYSIMTWAPLRGGEAAEASKRFLGVHVSQ